MPARRIDQLTLRVRARLADRRELEAALAAELSARLQPAQARATAASVARQITSELAQRDRSKGEGR